MTPETNVEADHIEGGNMRWQEMPSRGGMAGCSARSARWTRCRGARRPEPGIRVSSQPSCSWLALAAWTKQIMGITSC